MRYSKFVSILGASLLFACAFAVDADAQGKGGGRPGGGGGSRGPSVGGRTAPSSPRTGPRVGGPGRVYGGPRYGGPYRPGYYPYYRYPYYRFPSLTFGFAFGYPYYYGYYGYPYYSPYYGYPYYGAYGYPYAYGGYAPPPAGYVGVTPGAAWGEVRIEGAPKDAQVYADGQMVGTAGDFDGPVHHLQLEAGRHAIEVHVQGLPPRSYDVEVRPGQTMSVHVGVP
jgi:PEGA domain-containing protein